MIEQHHDDNAVIQQADNVSCRPHPEPIPRALMLSILATGIMAFIGILTETLMNVLFPILMGEFHVSTSTVQWLTTGYLLVVSLVVPLSSYGTAVGILDRIHPMLPGPNPCDTAWGSYNPGRFLS